MVREEEVQHIAPASAPASAMSHVPDQHVETSERTTGATHTHNPVYRTEMAEGAHGAAPPRLDTPEVASTTREHYAHVGMSSPTVAYSPDAAKEPQPHRPHDESTVPPFASSTASASSGTAHTGLHRLDFNSMSTEDLATYLEPFVLRNTVQIVRDTALDGHTYHLCMMNHKDAMEFLQEQLDVLHMITRATLSSHIVQYRLRNGFPPGETALPSPSCTPEPVPTSPTVPTGESTTRTSSVHLSALARKRAPWPLPPKLAAGRDFPEYLSWKNYQLGITSYLASAVPKLSAAITTVMTDCETDIPTLVETLGTDDIEMDTQWAQQIIQNENSLKYISDLILTDTHMKFGSRYSGLCIVKYITEFVHAANPMSAALVVGQGFKVTPVTHPGQLHQALAHLREQFVRADGAAPGENLNYMKICPITSLISGIVDDNQCKRHLGDPYYRWADTRTNHFPTLDKILTKADQDIAGDTRIPRKAWRQCDRSSRTI